MEDNVAQVEFDTEAFTETGGIKRLRRSHNFKYHIAVREKTFKDFKELKDEPGSDAFLRKLLTLYSKMAAFKRAKEARLQNE